MRPPRRAYRTRQAKIAGVCGGIAKYFHLDPTLVRAAWLAAALFQCGGIMAYLVAWAVMPQEPAGPSVIEIEEIPLEE